MRRRGASLLAATAVLAGCGSGGDGDPVLTVYLSAPLTGPSAAEGRDIADGAQLALEDAGGLAAGIAVELEVLDDATSTGWDAALTGANARMATRDSTTIAYIGELDAGATRTSLPLTNEAGILQVSAGSGATDLTEAAIGSDQVPVATQPSGTRTFGRVIPSDVRQGEAAGILMRESGVEAVGVEAASGSFAESLVAGIESADGGPAVVAGPDSEVTYVAREDLVTGVSNVVPSGEGAVFGSDALLDADDLTGLRILTEACRTRTDCPGEPREIRLTSAAMDTAQLPPAATGFLTDFESAYDREPGRYAAYGYEAMAVILDSIERAEDPLDREAVSDAFYATDGRASILGTYSIDEVGDSTLERLGSYEIVGGRPRPAPEALTLP